MSIVQNGQTETKAESEVAHNETGTETKAESEVAHNETGLDADSKMEQVGCVTAPDPSYCADQISTTFQYYCPYCCVCPVTKVDPYTGQYVSGRAFQCLQEP